MSKVKKMYEIIEDLGDVIESLAQLGQEGPDIKCKKLTVEGDGIVKMNCSVETDDLTLNGKLEVDHITTLGNMVLGKQPDENLALSFDEEDEKILKTLTPGEILDVFKSVVDLTGLRILNKNLKKVGFKISRVKK